MWYPRNSPELGFGFRYPSRDTQRECFRWMFIFSYLLQGALFSAVLVSVSADKTRWVVNVGFDIVLIIIFTIYFHSVHNQNVRTQTFKRFAFVFFLWFLLWIHLTMVDNCPLIFHIHITFFPIFFSCIAFPLEPLPIPMWFDEFYSRLTWIRSVLSSNIISSFFFSLIFSLQPDSITRCFLLPQRSYVVFPSRKALVINIVLAINMYAGRLPALYYTYNKMLIHNEVLTGWLNYDNVLLIVSFSVLPIAFAAMYWSISFMLFRREFTACPGK